MGSKITDKNGKTTSNNSVGNSLIKTEGNNKATYKLTWCFDDWNGSEDVIQLCKKYLDQLTFFIIEGVSKSKLRAPK